MSACVNLGAVVDWSTGGSCPRSRCSRQPSQKPHGNRMSRTDSPAFPVLFEDNHLLVVNKPPMLPTMGVAEEEDSLYRRAAAYLKQKYHKPGNVYVGIVSRLDAHASGVIVLARTSKAASRLSDQMRRGAFEKRYLALIEGAMTPAAGELSDRVVKNEARHRMEVVPRGSADRPGQKEARLRYRTLRTAGGLSLVEVELLTGRKHQIRVQFQHAGHPLLGDRKYGSQFPYSPGIALHSYQLAFEHPTLRVLQSFQAEPPHPWPLRPSANG